MNKLQHAFYGALILLALIVGGYGKDLFEEKPKAPAPDTIRKEVEVPKVVRETTKVEVPRTVTQYKTIRDTVVREIPVPMDFGRVRGVLPQNYLERTSDAFSVTYFDPNESRYRTETYDLTPNGNALSLGITGIAHRNSVFIGPHVKFDSGRIDVSVGYGVGISEGGYFRSPFVGVQVDLIRYGGNLIN